MRYATALVICALLSPPASAKPLKQQWNGMVQTWRANRAQKAKVRHVKRLRAGRQRHHRAQARQFRKDFKAWAKDPQIQAIYRQQKQALGLGRLRFQYGLTTGLAALSSLGTMATMVKGGNAAGQLLATYVLASMIPDGNQLPLKAQQARMTTLIQAQAQGHAIPKQLLPVYRRELRIARIKAGRRVRQLQQELRGAEGDLQAAAGRLGQVQPLMGNVKLIGQR